MFLEGFFTKCINNTGKIWMESNDEVNKNYFVQATFQLLPSTLLSLDISVTCCKVLKLEPFSAWVNSQSCYTVLLGDLALDNTVEPMISRTSVIIIQICYIKRKSIKKGRCQHYQGRRLRCKQSFCRTEFGCVVRWSTYYGCTHSKNMQCCCLSLTPH